ncbi:ABC transporter ATP-binding protein [Helcococcus kunzii]|uniref:ABC transporter ATP-binding protein n=1 Tax=Helcococcus kunzii TaxID=40091 RepID=UPI0024ACE54C|nr:ABC transporter ATP-binding protein [Helcococcus kunzii]
MIKIKNLNKFYNRKKENELHVLKNLNFELYKNSFVSIMGTSGVGKSTLLNIIGGIEDFDSGEYFFNDIDMKNISNSKLDEIRGKQISFVYQEYLLIEEDTVIENVKVPLYFDSKLRGKNINKMAEEALLKVGIDKKMHKKKCSKLSGGQKQRVAIARAIVNNPQLILADEPTGAVDEETSKDILNLFRSLISPDLSIIIVTHDPNVAKYTDKIFKMVDGEFENEIEK